MDYGRGEKSILQAMRPMDSGCSQSGSRALLVLA